MEIDRASRKENRRRQLLEDRETLYESIQELDFDYRMGKVEEDDYRQTRARYESQAVELLKAIDGTNGRAEAVEDRIEQEIAALRRSPKGKKSCLSELQNRSPRQCPVLPPVRHTPQPWIRSMRAR